MTYVRMPGEPVGYSGYHGTEQCHTRAPFLLLGCRFLAPENAGGRYLQYEMYAESETPTLYAAVRRVALRQCGHFMMGAARLGGRRIIVSGAYGNDGLPEDLSSYSASDLSYWTLAPEDIARAFWHPVTAGWNSSGSEYKTVAGWATTALHLPARRTS